MSKNEKSKKEFMEQLYHQYYQSLMRQALYYIRFDRQFFHIAHDSVMDTFDAALASQTEDKVPALCSWDFVVFL